VTTATAAADGISKSSTLKVTISKAIGKPHGGIGSLSAASSPIGSGPINALSAGGGKVEATPLDSKTSTDSKTGKASTSVTASTGTGPAYLAHARAIANRASIKPAVKNVLSVSLPVNPATAPLEIMNDNNQLAVASMDEFEGTEGEAGPDSMDGQRTTIDENKAVDDEPSPPVDPGTSFRCRGPICVSDGVHHTQNRIEIAAIT
jgi:hypothetical protein